MTEESDLTPYVPTIKFNRPWRHYRLPGEIKLSVSHTVMGGDGDRRQTMTIEHVVLEEIPLSLVGAGHEHIYPTLRRMK